MNTVERWFEVFRPAILDPDSIIAPVDGVGIALDQWALRAYLIATESCEELPLDLFVEICDTVTNQLAVQGSTITADDVHDIVTTRVKSKKHAKRIHQGVVLLLTMT